MMDMPQIKLLWTIFVEQILALQGLQKLDGVGPVDNRPSTDKLTNLVKTTTTTKKLGHVTHDT